MRRKFMLLSLMISLLVTGCSAVEEVALYEIGDWLGTGETTAAGEIDFTDLHGNKNSFFVGNFDVKEVGSADLEQLPAYDFSGPANLGLDSSNKGEEFLTVVSGEAKELPFVYITIYNDYEKKPALCPNTAMIRDDFVVAVNKVYGIDDPVLANKKYKEVLKKIGKSISGESLTLSELDIKMREYVLKNREDFSVSSDEADVYGSGDDAVYDVQLAYVVASGVRSRLLNNDFRCTINRPGYERGQEGATTKTKISRANAAVEAKADLHIILDFSEDGFKVAYRDDNPSEDDIKFAETVHSGLLQVKHDTIKSDKPVSFDDPTLNWSNKCPTIYVSLDAMTKAGVDNYSDKDNVNATCDAIVKAIKDTLSSEE